MPNAVNRTPVPPDIRPLNPSPHRSAFGVRRSASGVWRPALDHSSLIIAGFRRTSIPPAIRMARTRAARAPPTPHDDPPPDPPLSGFGVSGSGVFSTMVTSTVAMFDSEWLSNALQVMRSVPVAPDLAV